MTAVITSAELRERIDSPTPPRILDVRSPAEFESSHIDGSFNVPLDVLGEHRGDVAERLRHHDVVLVCTSGQRATRAAGILQSAGISDGRVLAEGITHWEKEGFDVVRGVQRWHLERQVRLVAGSIVLSSVIGSAAFPRLKWLAAFIGGGLTYAAVSDTCAMATALSRLPYNRAATTTAGAVISRLQAPPGGDR